MASSSENHEMASVPTENLDNKVLTSTNHEKKQENVELKRELGLFSAVSLILGVMIGSGIFVSPGSAFFNSGSVGLCIIVWTVCGIISLIGALAFAELGTVVPKSGAEYAYFTESFNDLHPFWGPIPAFICSWIYVVILRPAEVAIITLTFADYVMQPIIDYFEIEISYMKSCRIYVALLALGMITFINATSVKLYVKVQNVFSSFKIIACLVVIIGGIYAIAIGYVDNLAKGFEGTNKNPTNIALAFYSGLWAYDGWSTVTTVTEEVKNPSKNIPRSILISVPLVTFLYVFMNIAYMAVLTKEEMEFAPAIAVAFGLKILGPVSFIIPVGVALATFGCALSIQFGVTRLCYVAGREGHMVKVFSYIHVTRFTPAPAVVFQGIIAFLFTISGNVVDLIDFASFLIWLFYGGAMVSLIILRRTKKDVPRPYKVPIYIPYFVLAVSLFLIGCPILTDPSPKYLFALGFILSGIVVYIPFVYYKKKLPGMDRINKFIQIIFNVVPPTNENENEKGEEHNNIQMELKS